MFHKILNVLSRTKTRRILPFALVCLCTVCFAFIKWKPINDDGAIYEFVIPKQGVMIDNATCYAWIPPDVGTIRSIIVHLHGCTREGDARQMMYDIQWRELARKWHSVLLAPKFISGGNAKACVNWYNPANGSDPVFLRMLDTL